MATTPTVVRHVTLQLPPDERLIDLMQAQEDRERRDESVLGAAAEVQAGVDDRSR